MNHPSQEVENAGKMELNPRIAAGYEATPILNGVTAASRLTLDLFAAGHPNCGAGRTLSSTLKIPKRPPRPFDLSAQEGSEVVEPSRRF